MSAQGWAVLVLACTTLAGVVGTIGFHALWRRDEEFIEQQHGVSTGNEPGDTA